MTASNVVEFFGNVPKKRSEAAAWYAEKLGWRIMPLHSMRTMDGVPVCSCGDHECSAPGKHPLVKNGEATNDVKQITAWWKKWPWANIGFWLEDSGLACLDVDIGAGKDGAARLREILGETPLQETLVCATPSGGKHIYYKERAGLPNKSNALGAGLDVWRGKHYLILPPSNHKAGSEYRWEKAIAPIEWPDILMPRRGRPPGGTNPNAGRPATRELLDIHDKDDVARLGHSLAYVDAADRDTWVHVGYILARLYNWNDTGWQLYREWSATAENYDEKKSHAIYFKDSHNPPDGMALTTGYIFKKATAHPDFTRWEKKDSRIPFFQNEGREADDLFELTRLVCQTDLEFYEREGRLIEVLRIGRMTDGERARLLAAGVDRHDSYCITRDLTIGQFIVRASPAIAWWKKLRGKMTNVDYDRRMVGDFIGMGDWPGLKKFRAFTLHPTIRSLANPTPLLESGFDSESGLYLEQPMKIKLPTKLGLKEAKAAARVLLSPFEHFAWIDGEATKACVLALVLTVGIRHCFRTAPMFLASSPLVGSGKTKLMNCMGALWYGAPPPSMVFVENEEEMEKRIGASVMAGDRIMLFDNVMAREVVNDRTLNMILTSGAAQFRVLGESTQVRMSAPMTIMMTGNQMNLGPDLARRTVELKIDPQGTQPTTRKFPFEPVEFVLEHRKKLIEAAMTIYTAFFASLKGEWAPVNPVPSFEEWSVIRDMVEWLGMGDVSQFADPKISDDDLYYPNVVKRLIELLASLAPEANLFDKKTHPNELVPLLMARGREWESVFHDALEAVNYGYGGDRTPKPDDHRTLGALLAKISDQVVVLEDGSTARLKAVKRHLFWLERE